MLRAVVGAMDEQDVEAHYHVKVVCHGSRSRKPCRGPPLQMASRALEFSEHVVADILSGAGGLEDPDEFSLLRMSHVDVASKSCSLAFSWLELAIGR